MRKLSLLVRCLVTAGALVVLVRSIGKDEIVGVLRAVDLKWLALALVIFLLAQLVSSLRCVYIARILGGELSFTRSVAAHFVGLLFNQVLPTSLGGDVVKASMLRHDLGLSIAIRSTILDRASGLIFLLASIVLLLPAYQMLFHSAPVTALLGLGAGGALLALALCCAFAGWLEDRLARVSGAGQILQLFKDIRCWRGRSFGQQFWTSLVVHVNGIAAYALIGRSVGVQLDWLSYFLIVPLVFLIALLPVSLAGWGTREIGAVWLFGFIGLRAEQSLTMSIMFGVLLVLASLPGLVYLVLDGGGKQEPKQKIAP